MSGNQNQLLFPLVTVIVLLHLHCYIVL